MVKPGKQEVSRLEQYGIDHPACEMPKADALIVKWFFKLGKCSSNGMSFSCFEFSEIESFNNLYKLNLCPWEIDQLMMMSTEYSSMLITAKDELMSSPWHEKTYDELEEARSRVLRNGKIIAKSINKK